MKKAVLSKSFKGHNIVSIIDTDNPDDIIPIRSIKDFDDLPNVIRGGSEKFKPGRNWVTNYELMIDSEIVWIELIWIHHPFGGKVKIAAF